MAGEEKAAKKPAEPTSEVPTFEEALTRLESIVGDLEEGQIGLAEGLARYEQGVKLLKQCYQLLEAAERRIELLNRVDAAGQEECEPFDESESTLEEKAPKRGRRRSRPATPDAVPDRGRDGRPGPPLLE